MGVRDLDTELEAIAAEGELDDDTVPGVSAEPGEASSGGRSRRSQRDDEEAQVISRALIKVLRQRIASSDLAPLFVVVKRWDQPKKQEIPPSSASAPGRRPDRR